MAILDENTQFELGVYSGDANQMRLSGGEPNGETAVQFIHFKKITKNHVDTAQIVGSLKISDADLRNLSEMILTRLKQIDQAS